MPSQNTYAQLAYQVCPIVLTNGIAVQIPGSMLPLLNLFTGVSNNGLGLPYNPNDLDNSFAAFNILPGGTLISQQIAKYPFANQSVAANATIKEPLTLSVIMDVPMRGPNAWSLKLMLSTALKGTLDTHNNRGGTYTVMTPSYMYTDLIMTSMTDNSRGNNSLPQNAWRFDFEKPLVALTDLQGAQNQLMSKISNQVPTGSAQTGSQVGSTSPQAHLNQSPTVGLIGGLHTGSPTVFGLGQALLNNPAFANAANFPFVTS